MNKYQSHHSGLIIVAFVVGKDAEYRLMGSIILIFNLKRLKSKIQTIHTVLQKSFRAFLALLFFFSSFMIFAANTPNAPSLASKIQRHQCLT